MNDEHENAVVVRALERVKFWEWNPRGNSYRGIGELMASLEREGLQDAIHVWERTDGDFLLKGHRRFEAMSKLGWTECAQVVHHFDDEAEAYRFLLEDHGHNEPLDAEEKIVAVEHGVKLGMTTAELAPSLGVTEERAQLWFDLGALLPQAARSALGRGDISLNTAELLLDVENDKERSKAAQMILKDMETGEPMAHGQARAYIQAHYVLPEKRRREWQELEVGLRKKFKVAKGYHFVEFALRREYTMGESGQPLPEYEFGDGFVPSDRDGRTWEALALEHGVPVYVVSAPLHAAKHVRLVNARMMRDALSVAGANDETGMTNEESPMKSDAGAEGEEATPEAPLPPLTPTKSKDEDRLRLWLRTWLGAIYEHLLANPAAVMTSEPWLPLREYLAHVTTDVDAGALAAWRGIESRKDAMAWMEGDTKQRAPLRVALMLLLCAESDASSQPEKIIREVAVALGLNGKSLDKQVAKAVK